MSVVSKLEDKTYIEFPARLIELDRSIFDRLEANGFPNIAVGIARLLAGPELVFLVFVTRIVVLISVRFVVLAVCIIVSVSSLVAIVTPALAAALTASTSAAITAIATGARSALH